MVEAIILAGNPKKKKRLIRGKNKFFIKINGNYLGNIVVDALSKSSLIDSIYIIGNKPELEKIVSVTKECQIIQEKGSFFTNAIEAFNHTKNSENLEKRVLYSHCDVPFLNTTAIEDFILNAPDADLIVPYCLKEDFENLFIGFEWPYLMFREGQIKLGNVALAKPNKVKNKRLVDKFFNLRKVAVSEHKEEEIASIFRVIVETIRICGVRGLEIVAREAYLKYIAVPFKFSTNIVKYLSLDRIGEIFSSIFCGEVKGVRTRFPEMCFDIDNESKELEYTIKNYNQIIQRINSR